MPNPSLPWITLIERMTATAPGEGDARSDCAAPGLAMRTAETSDSTRSWEPMRGKDFIPGTALHMEQYHWLLSERSGGGNDVRTHSIDPEADEGGPRSNPTELRQWI